MKNCASCDYSERTGTTTTSVENCASCDDSEWRGTTKTSMENCASCDDSERDWTTKTSVETRDVLTREMNRETQCNVTMVLCKGKDTARGNSTQRSLRYEIGGEGALGSFLGNGERTRKRLSRRVARRQVLRTERWCWPLGNA